MIGIALLMVGAVLGLIVMQFVILLGMEWVADRLLDRQIRKRQVK